MIALGDNLALLPKAGGDFPEDTAIESFLAIESFFDRRGTRSEGIVVFADGHVEALAFKRLFLDQDDESLRRWNVDHEPHR